MKALVYADLFDFPLTEEEIYWWYVGRRPVTHASLEQGLAQLMHKHLLDMAFGYYFLPGKNQLVRLRKNRLLPSTVKHMKAVKMAQRIRRIPGVLGVAVTGTVAVKNADADDDIDLMIVTQASRLWQTRLLVTSFLELMGRRRKPGQEAIRDAFCANLYLDVRSLTVPRSRQNLYTAHEVAQAVFLYDKHNVATLFLQQNRWIRRYLPNIFISEQKIRQTIPTNNDGWFERASYGLQRWYMARRMTREWVTASQAYFHPKDMAKIVLSRYDRSLKHYDL